MRVVAGKAKGTVLKTIESMDTRPTKDMVKEALFSIIMTYTTEAIFLDLFAGSGAIGIEALSRGAKLCYFADQNPKCIDMIYHNLDKTRMKEFAIVRQGDYLDILNQLTKEKFDIIFLDPPYHKGLGEKAILKISEADLLKETGILILETDEDEKVPECIGRYVQIDRRKYGRNILSLLKRKG